jgi:hypothetical protein
MENRMEYMRVYMARYRVTHPEAREKAREYGKKYYAEHKDDPEYKAKRNANTKRWIAENRDRWNAYRREYRRKRKAKGE